MTTTPNELIAVLQELVEEHPDCAERDVFINVRTDEVEITFNDVYYDGHFVVIATEDTFDDDEDEPAPQDLL